MMVVMKAVVVVVDVNDNDGDAYLSLDDDDVFVGGNIEIDRDAKWVNDSIIFLSLP